VFETFDIDFSLKMKDILYTGEEGIDIDFKLSNNLQVASHI